MSKLKHLTQSDIAEICAMAENPDKPEMIQITFGAHPSKEKSQALQALELFPLCSP